MKSTAPNLRPGQPLRHRLTLLITLTFLALLVGSLVIVISVVHRGSPGPASSSSTHTVTLGVYFGAGDGSLVKLDASNGQFLWRFHTQGRTIPAPPTVAGGIVYVGSTDGSLYALSADSGKKLWSFATGGTILGSPAVAGSVVYAGSDDSSLYALNAKTGEKLWSYHAGANNKVVSVGSPTVVNNVVFDSASDNVHQSFVFAVDAKTGARLWSKHVEGQLFSSPQVASGKVYISATALKSDGSAPVASQLVVFNAADGSQPNLGQQAHSAVVSHTTIAPPTVSGGSIYLGSQTGALTAINAATGNVLWQAQLHGSLNAAPAVASGMVLVGVSDATINGNAVVALNASTGAVLWQHPLKNYTGTNLVVEQGVLYVGAADGTIYALKTATGGSLWTYQDTIPFGNTPISVAP